MTRVSLLDGNCPCCAKRFKGPPPQDMPKRSPVGPTLRALVIYLRFTQGIAFERLATLLSDLLGLEISEGAFVNMARRLARRLCRADELDPPAFGTGAGMNGAERQN